VRVPVEVVALGVFESSTGEMVARPFKVVLKLGNAWEAEAEEKAKVKKLSTRLNHLVRLDPSAKSRSVVIEKAGVVVALLVVGTVFVWFGSGSTPQNGLWEFSVVGAGLLVLGILLAASYLMAFAGRDRAVPRQARERH